MNQNSLNWGIRITVIWLAVITSFWIFGGLSSPTSLNELGDFLGGIFAPIAFLWLILGYVQQGKQLEQNTKALEQQEKALQLQINEMKENVKQQREMVLVNERILKASFEKEKPEISYWFPSGYKIGNSYALLLKIHNMGKGDCYNLEVYVGNRTSTRYLKNFLKVRDAVSVSLILMDESVIEISDPKLRDLNDSSLFHKENPYTGTLLDLEIIFEFEDVYAKRFNQAFKITFPLKENFDIALREYDLGNN